MRACGCNERSNANKSNLTPAPLQEISKEASNRHARTRLNERRRASPVSSVRRRFFHCLCTRLRLERFAGSAHG